ncbi:MAG: hypothetical protein ACYC59_05580 [Anaerolineaceae bacterium]
MTATIFSNLKQSDDRVADNFVKYLSISKKDWKPLVENKARRVKKSLYKERDF